MATEYFDKTVYAVHIDDISKADMPNAYLGWWINVTQRQSLIVSQHPSEERLMDEFARMLKISNHRERVSTAMGQYQHLLAVGDSNRVQAILQSVLHEQMIETKARLVAKLFDSGYAGVKAVKTDDAFKTLARWKLCAIDGMSFRAPCRTGSLPRLQAFSCERARVGFLVAGLWGLLPALRAVHISTWLIYACVSWCFAACINQPD